MIKPVSVNIAQNKNIANPLLMGAAIGTASGAAFGAGLFSLCMPKGLRFQPKAMFYAAKSFAGKGLVIGTAIGLIVGLIKNHKAKKQAENENKLDKQA